MKGGFTRSVKACIVPFVFFFRNGGKDCPICQSLKEEDWEKNEQTTTNSNLSKYIKYINI